MATSFGGTDFTFGGVSLEVKRLDVQKGASPRVDTTHNGSTFKTYAAGIPEADTVECDHLAGSLSVGDTGTFASGTITITGTYRVESTNSAGGIDEAITHTTTFLRIS